MDRNNSCRVAGWGRYAQIFGEIQSTVRHKGMRVLILIFILNFPFVFLRSFIFGTQFDAFTLHNTSYSWNGHIWSVCYMSLLLCITHFCVCIFYSLLVVIATTNSTPKIKKCKTPQIKMLRQNEYIHCYAPPRNWAASEITICTTLLLFVFDRHFAYAMFVLYLSANWKRRRASLTPTKMT